MRRAFLTVALLAWAAQAQAAITFGAAGTECAVTATTCTPGVPAGLTSTSISIAILHSRTNTAHTCTANCTGWVAWDNNGDATGGRLSVWWVRGSYATAPTFGGPATESYGGRIWRMEGVITTGDPMDVNGGAEAEASASTYTGAAALNCAAGSGSFAAVGSMDNNTWGTATQSIDTPSGANATYYVANAAGTDNSVAFAYDITSPNTASAFSYAMSTLGPDAGRSFDFCLHDEPPPACTAGLNLTLLGVGGCP